MPFLSGCRRFNIRGVPGIELSSTSPKGELHILGYRFDLDSPGLGEVLAQYRNARRKRNWEICERLRRLGISISMEDIEAHARGIVGASSYSTGALGEGLRPLDSGCVLALPRPWRIRLRFTLPPLHGGRHPCHPRGKGAACLGPPPELPDRPQGLRARPGPTEGDGTLGGGVLVSWCGADADVALPERGRETQALYDCRDGLPWTSGAHGQDFRVPGEGRSFALGPFLRLALGFQFQMIWKWNLEME